MEQIIQLLQEQKPKIGLVLNGGKGNAAQSLLEGLISLETLVVQTYHMHQKIRELETVHRSRLRIVHFRCPEFVVKEVVQSYVDRLDFLLIDRWDCDNVFCVLGQFWLFADMVVDDGYIIINGVSPDSVPPMASYMWSEINHHFKYNVSRKMLTLQDGFGIMRKSFTRELPGLKQKKQCADKRNFIKTI
jgi:hypothetical protein